MRVVGAVGDVVGGCVAGSAAGMYTELGGHGDGSAEEENGVEEIESDGDEGVPGEGIVEGHGYQVKER